MELNHAVALVTGGGHGIGRALCHALATAGARVAVADLDYEAAEQVARDVGGFSIEVDVGREDDVVAAIERTEKELGLIDIFVSNAGVAFGDGPDGAASAPDEHWRACLDVNLMGPVYAALGLTVGSEVEILHHRGRGVVVGKQGNRVALGKGIAEKLQAEIVD